MSVRFIRAAADGAILSSGMVPDRASAAIQTVAPGELIFVHDFSGLIDDVRLRVDLGALKLVLIDPEQPAQGDGLALEQLSLPD